MMALMVLSGKPCSAPGGVCVWLVFSQQLVACRPPFVAWGSPLCVGRHTCS
jgi:hypothetical protein